MSDLPSLAFQALHRLELAIVDMRRGTNDGRPRPHKLLMLLAVLDMADQGQLTENRIYLNDELIYAFEKYFRLVSNSDDWCQPGPPFFHLRSSSFWMHEIKAGREVAYQKLTTSGGGTKRIYDNIEYAYLSEEAYLVVSESDTRKALRQYISAILNEEAKR